MKSRTLSKKERNKVNNAVKEMYDVEVIDEASIVRVIEYSEGDIISCDGSPAFIKKDSDYVPVLAYLLRNAVFTKQIRIDMGGVKPISGGADVMVPGIVGVDDVEVGDIATVVDENHGKPLSVVKVVMDKDDIQSSTNGVAAESIHNIGDDIWKFTKTL